MKSPHNLSSGLSDAGDNLIYLEDIYKHKRYPKTERYWLYFFLVHSLCISYLSATSPSKHGRVLGHPALKQSQAKRKSIGCVVYFHCERKSWKRIHQAVRLKKEQRIAFAFSVTDP